MKGTVADPQIVFETRDVVDRAQEALTDKAGKGLDGTLYELLGKPQSGAKQGHTPETSGNEAGAEVHR